MYVYFNHVGSDGNCSKRDFRYLSRCSSADGTSQLISSVLTGDWRDLVDRFSVNDSWKEVLVAAVTYASNQDFGAICSGIGDRYYFSLILN